MTPYWMTMEFGITCIGNVTHTLAHFLHPSFDPCWTSRLQRHSSPASLWDVVSPHTACKHTAVSKRQLPEVHQKAAHNRHSWIWHGKLPTEESAGHWIQFSHCSKMVDSTLQCGVPFADTTANSMELLTKWSRIVKDDFKQGNQPGQDQPPIRQLSVMDHIAKMNDSVAKLLSSKWNSRGSSSWFMTGLMNWLKLWVS